MSCEQNPGDDRLLDYFDLQLEDQGQYAYHDSSDEGSHQHSVSSEDSSEDISVLWYDSDHEETEPDDYNQDDLSVGGESLHDVDDHHHPGNFADYDSGIDEDWHEWGDDSDSYDSGDSEDFSDLEEQDQNPYLPGRKKKKYYPRVNPMTRYDEQKFIQRYRVSKEVVRELAADFGNSPFATTKGTKAGKGLSHEERVCLVLRFLATGSLYSVVGDSQGVHKSTVCRSVRDVVRYLFLVHKDYIKWPERRLYRLVAQQFYSIDTFPLAMGAVDGTHIRLQRPPRHGHAYMNRKNFHSMNVMAVCDAQLHFTYVDATHAGCQNDAFVWLDSALSREIGDGLLGEYVLLGDSGYALRANMMTPFANPTTEGQWRYNKAHRSTRSTIERAFGVLKQRWRCLEDSSGYIMSTPHRLNLIVIACCVLHNICEQRYLPREFQEDNDEDAAQMVPRQHPEQEMDDPQDPQDRPQQTIAERQAGIQKRNQIVLTFNKGL